MFGPQHPTPNTQHPYPAATACPDAADAKIASINPIEARSCSGVVTRFEVDGGEGGGEAGSTTGVRAFFHDITVDRVERLSTERRTHAAGAIVNGR